MYWTTRRMYKIPFHHFGRNKNSLQNRISDLRLRFYVVILLPPPPPLRQHATLLCSNATYVLQLARQLRWNAIEFKSHFNIIISHVGIIMLRFDINKSQVNKIKVHVEIIASRLTCKLNSPSIIGKGVLFMWVKTSRDWCKTSDKQ